MEWAFNNIMYLSTLVTKNAMEFSQLIRVVIVIMPV